MLFFVVIGNLNVIYYIKSLLYTYTFGICTLLFLYFNTLMYVFANIIQRWNCVYLFVCLESLELLNRQRQFFDKILSLIMLGEKWALSFFIGMRRSYKPKGSVAGSLVVYKKIEGNVEAHGRGSIIIIINLFIALPHNNSYKREKKQKKTNQQIN